MRGTVAGEAGEACEARSAIEGAGRPMDAIAQVAKVIFGAHFPPFWVSLVCPLRLEKRVAAFSRSS